MFLSTVVCTPLYLTFNLTLTIFITFDFAPVVCCVGELVFVRFLGICGFSSSFLIDTSSSDHRCKSCIISAGSGGFVRFFLSKHACFALYQLRLLGELLVATFDQGVFGLRPMWALNSEICVTPCGVFVNDLIILATSDLSLYGDLFYQFPIPLTYVLKFVSCSLQPLLLYDRLPEQTVLLYCWYCKMVETFYL